MYPHHDRLRAVLDDRSTLYTGNQKSRIDLVNRTLMATPHIEIGIDTPVEDALFDLMHRIARADARRAREYRERVASPRR